MPAIVEGLLVPPQHRRRQLTIVFVLDGLRPDSIDAEATPHLARLRAEGVSFAASHSVFPTVTRVNAASIATGTYPARHGIIGNTIFVPAVDAQAPFSSGDYFKLREVEQASGRALEGSAATAGAATFRRRRARIIVSLLVPFDRHRSISAPRARPAAALSCGVARALLDARSGSSWTFISDTGCRSAAAAW